MAQSNEYPRMVYHEDGSNKIVTSEQEENELGGEWSREPSEAAQAAQVATVSHVDPSGNEPLVRMLIDRMREAFPSLAADNASEEPAPAPMKRGPGRPPKAPEAEPASVNPLTAPPAPKKDEANG